MAAATSLISVDEYLRTVSDPDCEYVAGYLEERSVGEREHAAWQDALLAWFRDHKHEWNIFVYPELRIQVAPDRFRVPDVTILSRSAPREQIITHPPLAVFEILSPEDSMTRMLEKLADYERMGIGAIWIIEPKKPSYFQFSQDQLAPASTFQLPGTAFTVPMTQIESLID